MRSTKKKIRFQKKKENTHSTKKNLIFKKKERKHSFNQGNKIGIRDLDHAIDNEVT